MKYIDISLPVSSSLPIWPSSPAIKLQHHLSLDKGDPVNDTLISCSAHTGTHIDAPLHHIKKGKSVDLISINTLIGLAYIANIPSSEMITQDVLEQVSLPSDTKRLLLRTRNSEFWRKGVSNFQKDFVALSPDAARWIVDRGIILVGIDYLSIQGFYDGPETHLILLESEVVILEGINLASVAQGLYELYCLPINFQGIEAAPARALLKGPL